MCTYLSLPSHWTMHYLMKLLPYVINSDGKFSLYFSTINNNCSTFCSLLGFEIIIIHNHQLTFSSWNKLEFLSISCSDTACRKSLVNIQELSDVREIYSSVRMPINSYVISFLNYPLSRLVLWFDLLLSSAFYCTYFFHESYYKV